KAAAVSVVNRGAGLVVDARPQAPDAWLVAFARAVRPRLLCVHGPRAAALASALADAGLRARVLHAPRQLSLLDFEPGRPPRSPRARSAPDGEQADPE
ncbi:MAG: hypothetical protein KC620_20525, partial [Myxococcales bacterium]|nr:hypothetical protein [Myxococcales bacterium]